VFVELFKRGHIYRGKRMVNWCPVSLTALSDEEVIMKPTNGSLYHVRYELVDQPGKFIEVKTTRPETIPGDVAIAVHPDDPRYAALVGKKVWRPLVRAQIPIIADAAVDKEFGTGALKITPAHDKADFEIGQRHKLPRSTCSTPTARSTSSPAPSSRAWTASPAARRPPSCSRSRRRPREGGAYENNVGYSERADVPIEPRLTWQWWLRYPRVEEAKAAVRDGHIKFHPERWSKVYLHWLENIQDWCISRQLWWGHRIPVWYRKGSTRKSSPRPICATRRRCMSRSTARPIRRTGSRRRTCSTRGPRPGSGRSPRWAGPTPARWKGRLRLFLPDDARSSPARTSSSSGSPA
jgi:valyl-tRNA synthetase